MADAMTGTTATAPEPAARVEPAYRPPGSPPPQPSQPLQPFPLGYEPPRSRPPPPVPFEDVLMFLFRRAVFALGVGLLTFGLVAGFASGSYRDSASMAGWGAALIALVVPFPAMWRHWPKRS